MASKNSGFTIVELLVVIVIIGILAAITIVSYTGIQQKATVASLVSDLDNASKQLKLFQIGDSGSIYPTMNNCPTPGANEICLKSSGGATYQYQATAVSPQTFCLAATKGGYNYNITPDNPSLTGPCPVLNLDANNTTSYPRTGATWYDLSGNGNNGNLLNGVSFSSVNNNGVMSFDGVDDYVNVANNSTLNTGSITLSLRLYIRDNLDCDANNNWRSLIHKGSASGTATGFDVVLEEGRSIAWDTGTGTSDRWWPAGLVIPMNTWSNLTLIYDEGGYKYVYLDGALINTKAVSALPITSNSNDIYINNPSTACANGSGNFPGYIDKVRIYNRSLSANEVKALYDATK